jgi:hypothetical protein
MKVEVKQGSAEELIAYLEQHRDKQNLVLLIVDTEAAQSPPKKPRQRKRRPAYVLENGVPVLPKRGLKEPITPEFVKTLLEGDD